MIRSEKNTGTSQQERGTHSVSNLLHRFDVVARDELVVSIEELNSTFLEGTLGEQETLDTRQAFVWVVIGLLD